ncbi:hypothetical protein FHX81_4411 [Saccharothrix saharensis]|uniref:Uncharacterized protein n=1 Tax=Saccharothrix saharensis TaxID=571190 RepID=A0A543JGQ2_9PSEU|nr:hypothetical protein [Saccharothrix saharensis]TQM82019.1 hypothetical protein FHX81_4411 [Saccharothrix saharensis]
MTDDMSTAGIVAAALDRWDEVREAAPRAGDERFRTWFFEEVPVLAGLGDDTDTHAFLSFEVATELFDRGRAGDAFLVLRWLGRHFTGAGVRADTRVRAIMALTDTCVGRAVDQEAEVAAIGVLREVVDAARAPEDVRVERAVCRALSSVAHLTGGGVTFDRAKTRELAALWRELAERCRGSADPELRDWRAHAVGNEALLWLQADREDHARRLFAVITAEFGADRPGVSPDVDVWVVRARLAPTVLDRFSVGEAELKLDYLERQRHWDRRRRFTGLGFARWLLGGAPRNHLRELVRRARDRHRKSAGQVRAWLCAGEPFVLLLRNFDLTERSGIARDGWWQDPEDPADHVQVINLSRGGRVLGELAAAVPLVVVASTTAGELELGPDFGQFTAPVRLYLPDETWFDTVSTLIAVADQVIVWAAELSPGLARELDALTAEGRTDDTLVVLDASLSDPVPGAVLPRTGGEPLTREHPALAAFPHVVAADELDVPGSPPLARVLDGLDAARRVPVEQRLARLTAR